MRVLRVAQKAYPDDKGGGAYHVHAMSRDQAARGHEVTVLTVGDGPRHETRDGYDVVRCPARVSALGNDIAPGVWRRLRDADAFDVVHAHSHLYFSTNLAAVRRRLGDTPLALTNHGLYSQNAPTWLFDRYLRTVGRWTFDAADVVFCYTDEDRDRLDRLGVGTDVAVVANGVDTGRFRPDGPASDLVDHDGPVALFVGRLVEGKRPQDAVAAVDRLAGDLDLKLYVVGDGPMRVDLRADVTERGLDGSVEFLGHVPYDEMPRVYRCADVLVLPSRAEGLPRTVLEAFASGVPVVSSHLEQTAPVVEEAGQTVEVGDVDGYEAALREVLSGDPGALGERGRALVEERFRWADTVTETTDHLRTLL